MSPAQRIELERAERAMKNAEELAMWQRSINDRMKTLSVPVDLAEVVLKNLKELARRERNRWKLVVVNGEKLDRRRVLKTIVISGDH